MSTHVLMQCANTARDAICGAEDRIEALDRAIGDGDHYYNVRRGAETAAETCAELGEAPADEALKALGMKLMSTIGGASGPLMSSFFLAAAKTPGVAENWTPATVAAMVRDGVDAIRARGKAGRGDKTMLDVLIPVADALDAGVRAGADTARLRATVRATAEVGMLATRDMLATKGRAAFLGERARGHIDPGAMSCFVIIDALCAGSSGGRDG